MAGVHIQLDIRELIDAQHVLDALADNDTRALADEIGNLMVDSTDLRFNDEISPDGERWKPSQRALEKGDKTLQDRGILRGSVTYKPSLLGDSVEVGSEMIYTRIHQLGGDAGRNRSVRLPPRPFIGLSDDDKEDIGDAVMNFYDRLIA